jgi:hypothetical protein
MHRAMAQFRTERLPTAKFECELVLRGDREVRIAHSFLAIVEPQRQVRIEGRDWTVVEVRERRGKQPEVICSPAKQRP